MKMIDNNHSFSPAIAKETSVQKAILLKEIGGWCEHNYENDKNIDKEGLAWVFMSVGEKNREGSPKNCFAKKFFYMPKSSIYRWLDELEKDEWIYTKVENKKKYDKTKSYRLNVEKYNMTISQNERRNSQNEKSISQNERPIHSLNNSISNNINIKEEKFLSSLEAKKLLDEWLADDNHLRILEMVVRKKFDSVEDAREFYTTVANNFCEDGFSRYASYRRFKGIADILPKYQSWCRNAKYTKPKFKHRLGDQYTQEEFEIAVNLRIEETKSKLAKKELAALKLDRVMRFLSNMLEKIVTSPEFKGLEPVMCYDLVFIYLKYRNNAASLRKIFSDISYAPKHKTVMSFIKNREKFI